MAQTVGNPQEIMVYQGMEQTIEFDLTGETDWSFNAREQARQLAATLGLENALSVKIELKDGWLPRITTTRHLTIGELEAAQRIVKGTS